MHLTYCHVFKNPGFKKAIADFPGETEKISSPFCVYTSLCVLVTESNRRWQIILALTGWAAFPTSCFQQSVESFFRSSFSVSSLYSSFIPCPTARVPDSMPGLVLYPSVKSLQGLPIGEYLRFRECHTL